MALHHYVWENIDGNDERQVVSYRLATIAGVIGVVLTFLLNQLPSTWPTLVAPPSTLAVYLTLLTIFDHSLWRTKFGRLIGVTTPCLEGNWIGRLEWKNQVGMNQTNEILSYRIRQTWRRIGISFQTNITHADSQYAVLTPQAGEYLFRYEYQTVCQDPSGRPHLGSARIRFPCKNGLVENDNLVVWYYTQHQEVGTIYLKRIEAAAE